MVPRISEMIEASRPNEPPVMMSGPDSVPVRIDSSMSPPDTANPNTFPCVKFHAQWMPIGNHSEFVYLYAAPSRTPEGEGTPAWLFPAMKQATRCRLRRIDRHQSQPLFIYAY